MPVMAAQPPAAQGWVVQQMRIVQGCIHEMGLAHSGGFRIFFCRENGAHKTHRSKRNTDSQQGETIPPGGGKSGPQCHL